MADKRGLYSKYIIEKADGSPVDPDAYYFVLRLDADRAARHAARTYARDIESTNPGLAADLRAQCERYWEDDMERELGGR